MCRVSSPSGGRRRSIGAWGRQLSMWSNTRQQQKDIHTAVDDASFQRILQNDVPLGMLNNWLDDGNQATSRENIEFADREHDQTNDVAHVLHDRTMWQGNILGHDKGMYRLHRHRRQERDEGHDRHSAQGSITRRSLFGRDSSTCAARLGTPKTGTSAGPGSRSGGRWRIKDQGKQREWEDKMIRRSESELVVDHGRHDRDISEQGTPRLSLDVGWQDRRRRQAGRYAQMTHALRNLRVGGCGKRNLAPRLQETISLDKHGGSVETDPQSIAMETTRYCKEVLEGITPSTDEERAAEKDMNNIMGTAYEGAA